MKKLLQKTSKIGDKQTESGKKLSSLEVLKNFDFFTLNTRCELVVSLSEKRKYHSVGL